MQRAQLVGEITYNALTLVQDPYGNYEDFNIIKKLLLIAWQVVQYILDLNESRFSDALIRQFTGNICALSVQKFSSNVIEKVGTSHANFHLLTNTRSAFVWRSTLPER
jgi:hypothetical protein